MVRSFAHIRTPHAKKYLTSLASVVRSRDWGHPDGDTHLTLQLTNAICEVAASDRFLDISITANSVSDATTLEDLVSDCLDDAVGAKDLHYQWILTGA